MKQIWLFTARRICQRSVRKGLHLPLLWSARILRDVLVLKEGIDNPKRMATGSPRRRAQLRNRFEGCEWTQLRGNVETRLRKIVEQDEADGTILAAAGLARLGFKSFSGLKFIYLSMQEMVPAAGQGRLPFSQDMRTKNFLQFWGTPIPSVQLLLNERFLMDRVGDVRWLWEFACTIKNYIFLMKLLVACPLIVKI